MNKLSTLLSMTLKVLIPLVRILLRNGVAYPTFCKIAKKAYVKVALEDFPIKGRKVSLSRVSILTGIHRKDVKRFKEFRLEADNGVLKETCNRAARVISGWHMDEDFRDKEGRPAPLRLRGTGVTFETLVKRFSGNIPARAVLDELERVNAIAISGEEVKLLTRAYLPEGDETMKLHILGTDVGALLDTINHNLSVEQGQTYLQRKVMYDNIPERLLAKFRSLSTAKAQSLLNELEGHLAMLDRDKNPGIEGSGRKTAGIAIYYFERNTSDDK